MLLILNTITALFTQPIILFDKQLATPSPEPFERLVTNTEAELSLFSPSIIFFDKADAQIVTPSPEPLEIIPISSKSRQWRLETFLAILFSNFNKYVSYLHSKLSLE